MQGLVTPQDQMQGGKRKRRSDSPGAWRKRRGDDMSEGHLDAQPPPKRSSNNKVPALYSSIQCILRILTNIGRTRAPILAKPVCRLVRLHKCQHQEFLCAHSAPVIRCSAFRQSWFIDEHTVHCAATWDAQAFSQPDVAAV